MKTALQVIHLEDQDGDAVLIENTLGKLGRGFSITRVTSRQEFEKALDGNEFDLILSDFMLPGFNGLEALKICRNNYPNLPFIFVTGTMGEEAAIESIQSGATDYVLKDRLTRLVPAVRRAMQEIEEKTARKRAEEQVAQAQKMELVGQLAGGVAHDFNNLLSVILGYNEVVLMTLEPDNPLRADIEEVKHAAERAAGLTRQLLSFSRKQAFQPVAMDINETVHSTNNILKRLIDEHIELNLILGKDIGLVNADSGYVGQVIMNLAVNARDAMPHGGKLTVETRRVVIAEQIKHHAPPGDYVMVAVSDTGVGMSDEIKARIFEPFFTTKPKDKGTGLGLATCRSIVNQCGGHIMVQSQPGRGTMFQVYFPRLPQATEVVSEDYADKPPPRGTETLLLVEDEWAVRHLAANALQGLGYDVLSASNGEDGLHVARDHKAGPIQLVITDIVMPHMGGKVMSEWLKGSYPNLKVLFTSGYTEDAMARHGVLGQDIAFFPKPYTPASLAHKVRAMLDSK